jgi:periplasmic protein TonB
MKPFCRLLVVGSVLGALVGMATAQEVSHPGNGVTLPVVVKEVRPALGDTAANVMLDCVVREDGTVSDIKVQVSPDPKLNQAAIDTLSQWRFKPGTKNGKPVPVSIHVELTFKRKSVSPTRRS